jgi:hypothetical protein
MEREKRRSFCQELLLFLFLFLPALLYKLVCPSLDLPVLECYLPLTGYEQDTVIGHRFLPFCRPDGHEVRFKADVRAAGARPVTGCSPVHVPDPDVSGIVTVIVPVLLQECMAG